jgi:hypothetical protein
LASDSGNELRSSETIADAGTDGAARQRDRDAGSPWPCS